MHGAEILPVTGMSHCRLASGRIVSISDRFADTDHATGNDTGENAAVATHRVVTAATQHFFHARTGFTEAASFEQHTTDFKLRVAQGQQVDAGHHEVAAQKRGIYGTAAQQRAQSIQMFALDQRDLAFPTSALCLVVTLRGRDRRALRHG